MYMIISVQYIQTLPVSTAAFDIAFIQSLYSADVLQPQISTPTLHCSIKALETHIGTAKCRTLATHRHRHTHRHTHTHHDHHHYRVCYRFALNWEN